MPYEFQGHDFSEEQVNERAIVAVLIGLALGVVFWSALFLAFAG